MKAGGYKEHHGKRERAQRAFDLARVTQDLLDVRAERTAANRAFNERIKKLEKQVKDLAVAYTSGQERRPAQQEMPLSAVN